MAKYAKRLIKNTKRAKEKIHLVFSQFRDARQFSRIFPEFSDYRKLRIQHEKKLIPAYEDYINQISTDDMAVSFQTSSFLYTVSSMMRPSRILDLGSGFSSFVFRLYSREADHSIETFSVDDSKDWLERTRSFLLRYEIGPENLFHWQDFCKLNAASFDLIFHDLGSMELRAETLPYVLTLLGQHGLIILDDMHSESYRPTALKTLKEAGFHRFSVRKYTLDKFGRFSEVAIAHSADHCRDLCNVVSHEISKGLKTMLL